LITPKILALTFERGLKERYHKRRNRGLARAWSLTRYVGKRKE